MEVANPIYDVVFKYLMEDNEAAKVFISNIIGENIIHLELKPQEVLIPDGEKIHNFTVFRLDFSATVKTKLGMKKIIVELQKAKLASDIMRFRRYLGKQYMDKNNYYIDSGKKRACPIVSIYILGEELNDIQTPVLKVCREYTDLATNEVYSIKDEFIESLTHDCYVIQIKYLAGHNRNQLEKLLSIFDQTKKIKDGHYLLINDEEYPEEFRILTRRLRMAAETEKMQEIMSVEDEIFDELAEMERVIELKDKVIDENKKQLDENKKQLNEKDRLLEEYIKKFGKIDS